MFSFWSPLLDCDDGDGCCACCFEYGWWWWCTTLLLLLLLLLCMCTLFALLSVGEPGEILPARAFNDWSIFIGVLPAAGSRCLLPSASFTLEEHRITRRFRFQPSLNSPQTLTDYACQTDAHSHAPSLARTFTLSLSITRATHELDIARKIHDQWIYIYIYFLLPSFPSRSLIRSLSLSPSLHEYWTQKVYTVHETRMNRHQFVSREILFDVTIAHSGHG